MARLAIALLAAICCAAVVAAADRKHMLADSLVASKSVKAKAASDYYDNTEMACMKQINFKNCRYTGCPVENWFSRITPCTAVSGTLGTCDDCPTWLGGETDTDTPCVACAPDSIYFQSDFTCCRDESYYGDKQEIGLVGFNDKIGTCDWEISMYRTYFDTPWTFGNEGSDEESDPWMPHVTDDGSALKWGTAWGTCYLNADAEHCHSPLCERMAINIQGGLYVTAAYSPDLQEDLAPPEEFCNNDPPPFLRPPVFDDPPEPRTGKRITTSNSLGGNIVDFTLGYIAEASTYYFCERGTFNVGVEGCGIYKTSRKTASFRAPTRKLPKSTDKVKIQGVNYNDQETYYQGAALVISGPMLVTSKKDHKLEETGMYEFTLAFQPWYEGGQDPVSVKPINRWPIVRSRTAKVRFTHEEAYYQGGSQ